MKTGQLLRALAAAAVGLAGLSANAQDYPSKDITLVVPYSAGGATDGYTRAFAEFLEKRKNLSPVVENRDGAGGTVGTESLRNSDPDGYTISYLSSSTLLSYAFLGREVTLGEDLDSAGGINETATIWVVNPAVIDVTTMDDLIAYLKANPGTSYASVGVGSTAHLTMIDFAARQGLEVEHIPYRGGAAAMGGLLSGEIGLVAGADPGSALPHIKEGTITALAIAGPERNPQVPDVPTTAETGYPDIQTISFGGFAVPHGTPDAVKETINDWVLEATQDPDFIALLEGAGTSVKYRTPEQMDADINKNTARYTQIIRDNNIQK